MEWSKGYVADIGYTAQFYREYAPSHMAFAALTVGRSPGLAFRPKRILELGFGQGFGLALLAAANPHVAFEGYDFNPEHVAHAKRLIQGAELSNLTVAETSFEEAAQLSRDNDIDVIALHGIFSWVARETQDAILNIVRKRLQPMGLLYISYNCMPGWAVLSPIRQFMLEVRRRNPGRSSDRQLALGLDMLKQLKDGNAGYFAANPSAAQHLDAMIGHTDRVYLVHEYLEDHAHHFPFSEMAERMADAKLSYLCSATLLENYDRYTCRPELLPVVRAIDDPILRETVRDYAINRRFRRDIFARGTVSSTAAEQRRMLSGFRFVLAVPRDRVMFKFPIPIGEGMGRQENYAPIVDQLAKKVASFDELAALPPFGDNRLETLLDCLTQLVNSGQVLIGCSAPDVDPGPAQRFNRMVVDAARSGRRYMHLASPVAGTGVPVNYLILLTLSAIFEGQADSAAEVAKHSMSLLKRTGMGVTKDGKPIGSDAEGIAVLEEQFAPLLEHSVPIWRQLSIL